MKKTIASLLALTLAASALLAGCGDQKGVGGDTSEKSDLRNVAFITGALGDKSFADLAWAGVKKAGEDYGIEAKACLLYTSSPPAQSCARTRPRRSW